MRLIRAAVMSGALVASAACGDVDSLEDLGDETNTETNWPDDVDGEGAYEEPSSEPATGAPAASDECVSAGDLSRGARLEGALGPRASSCFVFAVDRVSVLHLDPNSGNGSAWINADVAKRESAVTSSSNKLMQSFLASNNTGRLVPLPAGEYVLTFTGYATQPFDVNAHLIAMSDDEREWQHDDPGSTMSTAHELEIGDRVVDYIGTDDVRDRRHS
jgi:hypothetical protein